MFEVGGVRLLTVILCSFPSSSSSGTRLLTGIFFSLSLFTTCETTSKHGDKPSYAPSGTFEDVCVCMDCINSHFKKTKNLATGAMYSKGLLPEIKVTSGRDVTQHCLSVCVCVHFIVVFIHCRNFEM